MDRIIKYMRHSMNDGEHFTESEAMDLVSNMRVAESIVEKSLIYIRQRKFVKGIEE